MLEKNDGLYIFRGNGKFLVELASLVEKMEFFQFRMKIDDNDCLMDYNIVNKGFDIVSIPRRGLKYLPYLKALILGFRRIHHCDFLYQYYPGNINMILAIFAIIQRKPFGFYVRGEKGINSKISKYLFKRATILLTISPKFTEMIRGLGGAAETIRPMMEDCEEDIVTDRKYQNKPIYKLLYIGRIEYAKGLYDLIQAIKKTVDLGVNNLNLDIVGDGPDSVKVKQLVIDLELTNYITFHGTISERNVLRQFYRQSDLFVLPTHNEGFPRVLYEAMIAGTPILTSFVGTISYLMKDGYNCYRIPPKNPSELSDVIIRVIQDYENKSAVAIHGTETIKSYLSDKTESHAVRLVKILSEKGVPRGEK
jgi:glycosyltransferase involved in cell wall biosynthesis